MVSVQRFLALFPLRKFCSAANLYFKCFACRVCLEFLFDKNMYFESDALGKFLLLFAKSFILVLKKIFRQFYKKG